MKWFLCLFLTLTAAMGGTAFGEEEDKISLYVDGRKQELQYPVLRQESKMMIAAEDFCGSIGGILKSSEDGKNLIMQDRDRSKMDGSVWMDRENEVWISFATETTAWTGMVHGEQDAKGTVYIPLRAAASTLLYETEWSKTEDGEAIWLSSPTMPRLSGDATYDEKENTVTITLYNEEPQEFMYGLEYFLQKWNGAGWEEVDMVTGMDIDDIGFGLPGDWKKSGTAGESTRTYGMGFYGDRLEQGKYRICLPIHTIFYFGEYMPQVSDSEEESLPEYWQWKTFYEHEDGRPTFTLPKGISGRQSLRYVVSGVFEVKQGNTRERKLLFPFQKTLYFPHFCGMIKETNWGYSIFERNLRYKGEIAC